MKVLKFGGASVKDADAVRNVAKILRNYANEKLVVVISAMGKTTNALEKLLGAWFRRDESQEVIFGDVVDFHQLIIRNLFPDLSHPVYNKVDSLFKQIKEQLAATPSSDYDYHYDQLVSYGELISTTIIGEFLLTEGLNSSWFDARKLILTDDTWREARVDWPASSEAVQNQFISFFNSGGSYPRIALTQGFIGSTSDNKTTTLGREGSDYSAAIFSYIMSASEMTVWKDVPGILNADPKHFDNTSLIDHISYREAIELTYYGASVIHPKTIKPLQNKNIPLRVRSFLTPTAPGSIIGPATTSDDGIPSIILKSDQVLFSFSPRDFSFIAEDNLSEIFAALASCGIRVNMMQISAISFTICMDENPNKMDKLIKILGEKFGYRFNNGLQLITIRHYDQQTINRVLGGRQLLVEQRSRQTAQFVVKQHFD